MTFDKRFLKDVDDGLSKPNKSLPSKYFYDKRGSELFMKIMRLPEYYLTRAELDIFANKSHRLVELFGIHPNKHVELIELGSGDGTKTKHLLAWMHAQDYQFHYYPIDISADSLNTLSAMLAKELPEVAITTQHGDYFRILSSLKENTDQKIVFFLGSNLGNYTDEQAADFIYQLGANMHPDDLLVLGLDLVKPQAQVLPAYNDSAGVTREFNLNLLARINRELGANFELDQFSHRAEYDEATGLASSYLQSDAEQAVEIPTLAKSYQFSKGEKISVEISRKYSDQILSTIIRQSDFEIVGKVLDQNEAFADYVLRRVSRSSA